MNNGGTVTWDGEVFSINGGLDGMLRPDVLIGLSVNRSKGDFNFTDQFQGQEIAGDLSAQVLGVNPYMAWLRNDMTVWASGGAG